MHNFLNKTLGLARNWMLHSVDNIAPLQLFNRYQIDLDPKISKFTIHDETITIKLDSDSCSELIELLVTSPEFFKYQAHFSNSPKKTFPFSAWIISKTDLALRLATAMLSRTSFDEKQLESFAFFFNYIKIYDTPIIKSLSRQIVTFYHETLGTSMKPIFIKLLSNFVTTSLDEDWRGILEKNWKEGPRDLSLASLKSLLKFSYSDPTFFNDNIEQIECIYDLEILADVTLISANSKIIKIFADRVVLAADSVVSKRIKMAKVSKAAEFSAATVDSLFLQWSRVIRCLKSWPSASSPMDLLSLLVISGLTPVKASFKKFVDAFQNAGSNACNPLLTEIIPEALNHCDAWLHSCISRPLMQLFAQLIKLPSLLQFDEEVLLNLCRLFMEGSLGTSVRRNFVNHLAAHAGDEAIGERCLNLIIIFVQKFPDSRYICLNLIKSLLDAVDSWDPHLLVPFYSAYSLMAWASDSVMNDLILLLKKQIYSPDALYKRIGARGVCAFLATNGSAKRMKVHEEALLPDPDEYFSQFAACSQKAPSAAAPTLTMKSDYHLKIIISLLEESVKSLRSDRQAMLILISGLNECFVELDDEIKDWIGEWTKSVFQSSFITQIEEESSNFTYAYVQDEDNPLALNFNDSELADCAPLLLSILGRYEAYQNAGNLEGIDALQGCAIQFRTDRMHSFSSDFHLKSVTLNFFRNVLNTFSTEIEDRLSCITEIQKELKQIVKSRPPFLSEFKLFPEAFALIAITASSSPSQSKHQNESEISVNDNSILDELLKEARKPENRISRNSSIESKSQLLEVNDCNFNKYLIPLKVELIEKLIKNPFLHDFILQEIINLIPNSIKDHSRLLNCLLEIIDTSGPSKDLIDVILKFKTVSISFAQKDSLIKLGKDILSNAEDALLKEVACKLLIDYLKSPEQISEPLLLIKASLQSSQTTSAALKHLLSLKSIQITDLLDDMKNVKIPIKNRVALLKGFSNRFSEVIRESSSMQQVQRTLSHWADLVQFIRIEEASSKNSNSSKLLYGLVKESQSVLDSFLACGVLRDVENDVLLLKSNESAERESALSLLKTVQQSTRGLQIICNHLKYSYSSAGATGSSVDISAIPNLKKSLESVIFRVKEILTKSGCLGAFWMGNLKHRDLDGQELSSQVELLNLKPHNEDDEVEDDEINGIDENDADSNQNVKALSEEYIYDSDINDGIDLDLINDSNEDGEKDYLNF